MVRLYEIQGKLQANIMDNDQTVIAHITKPNNDSIRERLAIYRNAYQLRLLEVLEKEFPLLKQWMGNKAFNKMGRAYIDSYPSCYFSVADFPERLAQFLAETKTYSNKRYINELVKFMRTLNKVVDLPSKSILKQQDLAVISPDAWASMKLILQPSVALVQLQFNTLTIWQALIDNKQTPKPIQLKEPTHCLIWCKGLDAFYLVLTKQETLVIQQLQQGKTFGEICECLTQWHSEEEVANVLANILLRWLNNAIFAEVKYTLPQS